MGEVVTTYPKEYLDKFEVKREVFTDRKKALSFAKQLRNQGFKVKTEKFFACREDVWEVTGRKAKTGE